MGVEYIVSYTWDRKSINFHYMNKSAIFELRIINKLNSGKYMLVINLENRSDKSPEYYEFIEGVLFFIR